MVSFVLWCFLNTWAGSAIVGTSFDALFRNWQFKPLIIISFSIIALIDIMTVPMVNWYWSWQLLDALLDYCIELSWCHFLIIHVRNFVKKILLRVLRAFRVDDCANNQSFLNLVTMKFKREGDRSNKFVNCIAQKNSAGFIFRTFPKFEVVLLRS